MTLGTYFVANLNHVPVSSRLASFRQRPPEHRPLAGRGLVEEEREAVLQDLRVHLPAEQQEVPRCAVHLGSPPVFSL